MKKKLFIVLTIIFIIGLISLGIYFIKTGHFSFLAAENNTNLSLIPSTGSYEVGATFDVNIVFDSDGKAIDVVDIHYLNYNPVLLEVQDSDGATAGVQIKPGTIFNSYSGNLVDPTNGRIAISGLVGGGSAGFNGSGVFATITFKALSQGSANLNFDFTLGSGADCNAWEHSTAIEVLQAVSNANYILGTVDQSPIPEPSPSISAIVPQSPVSSATPKAERSSENSGNIENQATPTLTTQELEAQEKEKEVREALIKAEAERIKQAKLSETGMNTYILAGLIALFLIVLYLALIRYKLFRKHPNIKEM